MDRRLNLFGSEPYLIEIGCNVTITEGVKFITHDGGVAVLRSEFPGLNVFGPIKIHDNCFIGVDSIIMPGTKIGPNAVIGAGSVVTKDVPPNSVVAGVPARVLFDLDEYTRKALEKGVIITSVDPQARKEEILRGLDMRYRNAK